MTGNTYDDPGFFAGYSALRRSTEGLAGAPEWPALRAMLPDLNGARVLDLGCGFGWFSRFARDVGAISVQGVDVSEKMLAKAVVETSDGAIDYVRADLESFEPRVAAFDLAYSSLALHYVEDLAGLLSRVRRALVPGGALVASVEHPIYTAPMQPRWRVDEAGRSTWPVDAYQHEGRRQTDWLGGVVVKYHRSLATWINMLVELGFSLRRLEEWGVTDEQIAARPELAVERERPMFLLLSATRT
ncbi:MAG: class I SAM-dependent methyltransferase [Caulobacteraceae bacterium]